MSEIKGISIQDVEMAATEHDPSADKKHVSFADKDGNLELPPLSHGAQRSSQPTNECLKWFTTSRAKLIRHNGSLDEPKYSSKAELVESLKGQVDELRHRLAKVEAKAGDDGDEPETQKQGCDWTYGYVMSVRVRFGIIFVFAACLTLCCMVSFVLTILFSTILHDSTEDRLWGLRVGLLIPCAPIVLILGALLCDELIDLFREAVHYFPMHQFRIKMSAIVFFVYTKFFVEDPETAMDENGNYDLRLSHARIVEYIMPGIMEIVGLSSLAFIGADGSLQKVVGAYLTNTVICGCLFGLLNPIITGLCLYHPRIKKIHYNFSKHSPAIRQVLVHEDPPPTKRGLRMLTLCRFCVPVLWRSTCDDYRCCSSTCQAYTAVVGWWQRTVPWKVRVILDFGLLAGFAALSTVDVILTGIRWFFIIIVICLLGFKFRERFPQVFGWVYESILVFFAIAAFVYFLVAALQPSADALLQIVPPMQPNASSIVPNLNLLNQGGSPICGRVYGSSLTALDLVLLADIVYSKDTARMEDNLQAAFSGTNLENFTLVRGQDDRRTIHYNHVLFSTGDNVVTIRGTSTSEEAYTDTYLYSTISIFQILNTVLPFLQVFPDSYIRGMVTFLALPHVAGNQPYKWAREYVNDLKTQGIEPVITGHSLGGTIGSIVAAGNQAHGLFFSPPGLFYSSDRFDLKLSDIMKYTTAVVPLKDAIPNVDRQIGVVHNIPCAASRLECHSIRRTGCAIHRLCGDIRLRDWTTHCAEDKEESGLTTPGLIGIVFLILFVCFVVYALFKMRQRICPTCFPKSEATGLFTSTIRRLDIGE